MPNLIASWPVAVCLLAGLCSVSSYAQFVPDDVGTTVAGYQDDFNGASLSSTWTARGQAVYSVSGGMLHVTSAAGDPNHLLYEAAGYNNSVQEILARIRITNFGTGDPARAGIAAAVDPGSSQGINLLFRDEPNPGQRHFEFLDDARAWSTEYSYSWQNQAWYWLRLRHEPNAAAQGGVNDVFGKFWLADGSQPEPAGWQMTLDYFPTRSARSGFAGITAGSLGGTVEFDVDYFLIKASGLPSLVVAPNAFVQTPVSITNQPPAHQYLAEGSSATFSVGVAGNPQPTFQWYQNDLAVPGATNAVYAIPFLRLDHAGVYRVVAQNVVSNVVYTATSADAVLTVAPDDAPPRLVLVQALGLTQVQVTFSERIAADTATNHNHYQITNSNGPIAIADAVLDATQSNVVLNVSAMTEGATYTLIVNTLVDASSGRNPIAPNTSTNFTALSYAPAAIGNPQPSGGAVAVPGGLNITGGGADIGGAADQFQFSYQPRTGDFDVKVRLDSLSLADAWSKAGLMAREDVSPGARFAGAMATPTISGSYFQCRADPNAAATLIGSYPVNYPNMWLRLKRAANQFTGYAGLDGENWTLLGSASLGMPETVLLGFAVSSHNTNQAATAAFRDFTNLSTANDTARWLPREPLGQSSRRTSLVISEIMYNPLDRPDRKNLEFVELFNALSTAEDISGWRLDGDADFTFPPDTVIPAGGFLVVAQSPADLETVYGLSGVLGPFSNTNSLPNSRGAIQLRHRNGAVFLEARYDSTMPWPVAADGAGHSLVLARPSFGEGQVEAWAASDSVGGSPGRLDPVTIDPLRDVMINEFLAHTDEPELDYIELFNHGHLPVDISGCYLTDARNTNKFTIPPDTVLAPRGFVLFDQNQLAFALSAEGERIYFRNPSRTRVLDAVRFGPQANGVASGRFPDGAPAFSELAIPTPGTNNSALRIRDLVINEIMYAPISGNSDEEYVELYNQATHAVNLAGWRLEGGIDFTFPAAAFIPARGYLVIARNAAWLRPRYAGLDANNTVGDYSGSLANGGERIALAMPDASITTNNNLLVTNVDYVVVDEVTYGDGGRWGQWSHGGGSSLELIDPRSDNRLAGNWADSEEAAKAPWTTVSVTGVLDHGNVSADQLQVLLLGPGECLLDNVEVLTSAGVNLVANSTFESGAAGWTAEGTEQPSGLETAEGYNSARSYHVRASDRGDNQLNRIRTPLTAAQSAGVTNTIRAKVRWLRGHPEILFRLRGNWLEAAAEMDLPTHLGTPGAANSRAAANAAPAIYAVSHHPVLPAANETVVVTARVHDPDGLASVRLRFRVDPGAAIQSVPMRDDGADGDEVAGDGLYSATVPSQPANTLVAFHVQATDGLVPAATSLFPNDAPTRECLVRFGETVPSGSFPSYRIWMTQATFNLWDTRNNLNNTMNDVTFVLGNHRVIYNAEAAYAGSPYIAPGFNTPTGNRCGYSIDFPSDDLFLGDTALVLDWPGGHGNENTAIQEQMAYWMADQMDLPFSHRYFIRWTVNGVTDMQRNGVFEAVLQPGGEYLKQWSPGDSQGDFFKIDRAFEFNDSGGLVADPMPQLRVYTTRDVATGGTRMKTEPYRWTWIKRAYDRANDYTNIFVVANALNAAGPEPYTVHTEALADVEEWMGVFAAEHIINNFDSWGHDIGKNMYMYKPQEGRWQLYMFDLDWLMLVSPGGPGNYTATTGPLFSSNDPTVTRLYNHPPFRRAYFRAVQTAVDRAFVASKYEPIMDAKYQTLIANGITWCDGQTLAAPTAVKTWFGQRRTYLVGQLSTAGATFDITVHGGSDFTTDSNLVALTGTAPIEVKTIRVNGTEFPVTWTGLTTWSLPVVLSNGLNALTLQGYDADGVPLPNVVDTIRVTTTAMPESPVGRVVINEILYHPRAAEAEFVELYNASATTAFDLSGWRLNGLDLTFAPGTILEPGAYLVMAKDRTAFAMAYGSEIQVAGEYQGQLDNGGETLTLIQSSLPPNPEEVITRVTYDDDPPWPASAGGLGSSLQLIDANQDNSRVANWTDGNGWRWFTQTNTAPGLNATNVFLYLASAGDLYVDEVSLVEGDQPGLGPNLLANGGFESGSLDPWRALGTHAGSIVSDVGAYSGDWSLHLVATGAGGPNSLVSQTIPRLDPTGTYTISFRYLPSTNGTGLSFRVSTAFRLSSPLDYAPVAATPGAKNTSAIALPPFPPVWLNELLPNNLTGIMDNSGEREPWVELYNSGSNTVHLDGWHLADQYTNLTRWPFPAHAVIGPGQFLLIWLDGEPDETTTNALHANFRIAPTRGELALVCPWNSSLAVLDYMNYDLGADRSTGCYPDGQAGPRQIFFQTTPGAPNDNAPPTWPIYINEWMAANSTFLTDPADGQTDDWFELFNPNDVTVDLSGYALADNLAGSGRWPIPDGTTVAPRGFLLVWADDDVQQNGTNSLGLHTNFKLNQEGEAIALFAPNGSAVDAVSFGLQTNDISQGRWPDGVYDLYFMPTPTPGAPNVIPGHPPSDIHIVAIQTITAGQVVISWSSEAGRSYRLQYKDDLDAATWTDLPELDATATLTSMTNEVSGVSQRFYRVQQTRP